MEDMCCENCKNCLEIDFCDYSQGGCKHTKPEGDFVCLIFKDEGIACVMHGTSKKEMCEGWTPRT